MTHTPRPPSHLPALPTRIRSPATAREHLDRVRLPSNVVTLKFQLGRGVGGGGGDRLNETVRELKNVGYVTVRASNLEEDSLTMGL